MTVDFHTASNDNGPAYPRQDSLRGPSVRRQTRDAVVEAAIDNQGHDLRPGMFVTARLALGEQTLPAVPASAVRVEGTLRHVFVVTGGTSKTTSCRSARRAAGSCPSSTASRPATRSSPT